MSCVKKRQHSRLPVRMCALLLGFCMALNLSAGVVFAEDDVRLWEQRLDLFREAHPAVIVKLDLGKQHVAAVFPGMGKGVPGIGEAVNIGVRHSKTSILLQSSQ